MAGGGWLPLDLSLATAGTSSSAAMPAPAAREQRQAAGTSRAQHRRTVSSLFAELEAMLPNDLPTDRPASKEEIVEAAAARVRALEEAAAVLETYRAVRAPAPAPPSARAARPEVAVAVGTVCFAVRLPAGPTATRPPGTLTRVLEAFHRRGVEVLLATVARHGYGGEGDAVVTVTAAAAPTEVLELIRADIAAIY
ncbi:unnamed protein product [Urochloa humidicola]